AVLERKGARIGLLATAGFRDTLEIGRQMRHELYSIRLDPQTPVFLAPGEYRFDIDERVGAKGEVVRALDEASVHTALAKLRELDVDAVAVALLFSFLNPTHERRIRDIIWEHAPGLDVSLSSDVDPAFREYERTAVTAFDAYIKPVVSRYLGEVESQTLKRGVQAPLQVMQSRGGLAHASIARQRPVRLFLSGPAAGVIGGQSEGQLAGDSELITLDVGGTSSDIALISSAKALTRSEGVIDGFPVRVPMVDVNAIGAGGGSIAWIDDAGGLRVGPHSAGSAPGPACYGLGGSEATVTDASVVLGLLDPSYFAGGTLDLHPALARQAIDERIARPLGISVEAAAAGIHQVINAQMAEGIRLVSIARGYDPREFALVALGGGGPLHALALADELQIDKVIIPVNPGVLSASGLLAAPVEHEAATAFDQPLANVDMNLIVTRLGELDAQCTELMSSEHIGDASVEARYFADVCYIGQGYHLEIELIMAAEAPLDVLYKAFLEAHERVYGHATEGLVRFVNLRAVHSVAAPRTSPEHAVTLAKQSGAKPTVRTIRIPGDAQPCQAKVYRRATLPVGFAFTGPAVLEQSDTTTLITAGWQAEVHPSKVIVLRKLTPRNSS
ncbi:MAG: N-methylhydantoinase A/oxoprolinase/acetone carboxylase beta subunit, partial [Gammaproteobacteria bacterium]